MLLSAQLPGAAVAGVDNSMFLESGSYGVDEEDSLDAAGMTAAVADAQAAEETAPEGDVELLVLVSGIRNMPLVPG